MTVSASAEAYERQEKSRFRIAAPEFPEIPETLTDDSRFIVMSQGEDEIENILFSRLDAADEDLSESIFRHCRFEGCHFERIEFAKAEFTDIIFKDCDLSNCTFDTAYFCRVRFENCRLYGTDFVRSVF